MANHKIVLSLIVAFLVMSPLSAAAGWNAFGHHEPATKLDVEGGWMFKEPDVSPSTAINKVYFASWIAQYPGTTINPNLPEARSAFNAPVYAYWGMLGVWKDCNQDGYVGFRDQALLEYRTELLLDQSICPKVTTPNPIPVNWFPSHNDGQWVRELLPIQWVDTQSTFGDHNPYNTNDNGARVWFDEGLPNATGVGTGCNINPQPTGTYRSTGGVVKYADCFTRYNVTDNFDAVADRNAALQPYSFSDNPRDQYHSNSKANIANPWGSESDASDAQVWDCSQPQTQERISDPTASSPTASDGKVLSGPIYFNVSAPKVPPSVSTTGSAAGTANATGSGFDQCYRNQLTFGRDRSGAATVTGQATSPHRGDTLAHLPYAAEGDAINQPAKTSTYNLHPIEQTRTNNSLAALGPATPPNLGNAALGYLSLQFCQENSQLSKQTGLPLPSACSPGVGGDGLWFATPNVIGPLITGYMTAYAFVSPAAIAAYGLTMPKGSATGVYGQDSCAGATAGIRNGWDCDGTHWYLDAKGNDISPRAAYLGKDPSTTVPCAATGTTTGGGCISFGALPGSAYNLLSFTCYDQSIEAARQRNVTYSSVRNTVTPTPECEMGP